ncbi:hypothetical protein NVIE_008790 [Nitrososphaera viennensis EN76]|uniref:Uncharacterized protein n=1 Tax=Nitrososphaera viennensis EN76 TaxID=926571 RepID=A0A060HPG2_9ARCH|nr:hypothetical protein NVIE_008790 [Nitrososphaera viennensis EN76]
MAKIHQNIAIAAWLEKGKAIAWYVAPEIPIPAEDKQVSMGIQAELIKPILKTNEDYFGKNRYMMLSQENADMFMFPTDDPDHLLTRVVARPYDHNELAEKVMARLA